MKTLGILWDYNGTIVNDEHIHEKAVAEVLLRRHIVLTHEMYTSECLGQSDKASFENLKKIFPQLENSSVQQLVTEKTSLYLPLVETESIMWPGLKDLLQNLHEEFAMAIVTGSLRAEIMPTLEKEGIIHFFQTVITANDISRSKPDPEGYLKGIKTLNIPVENIVVIEDTDIGVKAAKAAGLKCIALEQGGLTKNLQEADKIVKMVIEITPELVKEVLKV
jgi:HAD superfamily hydrolase (TIGR01509 family)